MMSTNNQCLVCFENNSTLYQLYQLIAIDTDGNEVPLHEMLSYCCSAKLSPHLSPLICSSCSDSCMVAYNFIKLFRKNNGILNSLGDKLIIQKAKVDTNEIEEIKIEIIRGEEQMEVVDEYKEKDGSILETFEDNAICIENESLLENLEVSNEQENKDKNYHKCPICHKEFETFELWSKHITLHVGKNFICHLCNGKYNNAEEFQKHYSKDHYNCCSISQETSEMHNEYIHISKAHEDENDSNNCQLLEAKNFKSSNEKHHQCPICLKKFKLYSSWSKHIKIHPEKNFTCMLCNKEYENVDEFDKHYFKDHYNYCELCQTGFTFRKQYDYHRFMVHKDLIKPRKLLTKRKEEPLRRFQRRLTEQKCPNCKIQFKYMSQFLSHMKSSHADETIKCDICNESFSQVDEYLFHYDRQHLSYCSICDISFSSRHYYNAHKGNHEERPCYLSSKSYECPYCTSRHGIFDKMITHIKRNHEGATQCQICHQNFESTSSFINHYFKDHRIRCLTCKVYCRTQKQFDDHINKNYKGSVDVNKKTDNEDEHNNKKLIEKRSTNSSNHICPICKYNLSNFRYYYRHIFQHTDAECDNPLNCPICNEISSNAINFYKHYKTKHYILCDECSIYYTSSEAFENHTCKQNSEKCPPKPNYGICPTCGIKYKGSLKYHQETHTKEIKYKCETCGEKFVAYDPYRYHKIKEHGLMKHLCTYCGRFFISKTRLNEHLTIHTKIRKYLCDKCGQMFTRLSSQRKHVIKQLCGKRKVYRNLESVQVDISN